MSSNLSKLVVSVVLVLGAGCGWHGGSGVVSTSLRGVEAFSAVRLETPIEATVVMGAQQPLELQWDDNLLSLVVTEVEDDTLVVRLAEGTVYPKLPLTLRAYTPTLNAVTATAASSVTADAVQSSRMDIAASGASTVTLTGTSTDMTVALSGASELAASDFLVQTAAVNASGASEGSVHVTGSITGTVSGSSTLTVSGNPATRNITVDTSSTVTFP